MVKIPDQFFVSFVLAFHEPSLDSIVSAEVHIFSDGDKMRISPGLLFMGVTPACNPDGWVQDQLTGGGQIGFEKKLEGGQPQTPIA